MNAIQAEIYQLVVPSMPYILAAYGILWLGLMLYVGVVLMRLGKLEKQLALVEEACAKR